MFCMLNQTKTSVHSSHIGHPFLWTLCIPVILLFLQFNFHPSLFQKPENDFFQWKALWLWEMGEDKTHAALSFGFLDVTPNNIEAECNSCSGCVVPALREWRRVAVTLDAQSVSVLQQPW